MKKKRLYNSNNKINENGPIKFFEDNIDGDQNNLKPEPKRNRQRLIKICAISLWSFIIFGFISLIFVFKFVYDKMLVNMPEYHKNDLISQESSVIYDNQGHKIIDLGLVLRDNIEYKSIPENLINAFLSIEDSRFFVHNGFDIPRFLKAIQANIKAKGTTQGGSTIDMQLIKNSYFINDQSAKLPERSGLAGYARKVQEILLAIKANKDNSKKEILALYLNKLNFGNNIRGIQKASEYYFGKNTNELSISDSALLAGLINLPNLYNPYENLKVATIKRNEVLDAMVYHGYITAQEANLAKSIKLEDTLKGDFKHFQSVRDEYQYYIDAVIEETIELTGLDPQYHAMDIYTNMDPQIQKDIYNIQQGNHSGVDYEKPDLQNAIVVLENKNSRVIALGGGRNRKTGQSRLFNRATQGYYNPGSSIKPVMDYLPGIEFLGWASSHTLIDKPIFYPDANIVVNNVTREFIGDVKIDQALASSINTTAVQAMEQVIKKIGVKRYVEYLNDIGFKTELSDFNYQYALGGYNFKVTPLQLAASQAMILNYGKYIKPHTVNKIIIGKDRKEIKPDETGKQVVSQASAYIIAQLEKGVIQGPYAQRQSVLKYGRDYEIFAKTGTSDWGDAGVQYGIPIGANKETTLIFSNSEYTAVSWLGYDKAIKGNRNWISNYDLNRQIREKIANAVLDSIENRFSTKDKPYSPKVYERPKDCVEITHTLGVYPYAYGAGYQVTGLIDQRFSEVKHISQITIDPYYTQGHNGPFSINGQFNPDGSINVQITGVYGCFSDASGNRVKDISLVSPHATVNAVGRCFYGPEVSGNYTISVLKDGVNVGTFHTSSLAQTLYVANIADGAITVCANNGHMNTCTRIR